MLKDFLEWLQATDIGTAVRENGYLFPWVESIHVLAIVLVVGSIAIVDLRLLGIASRRRAVSKLTAEVLPFTWIAFAVAALTGATLFSSNAVKYFDNGPFRAKMILLILAGLNMIAFHLVTWRGVEKWDTSPSTPAAAKAAGALSISLWIAVVACGRWIGFTMAQF